MSERSIESLWACGVPCTDCPVAGLPTKERKAVDTFFVFHGIEADDMSVEILEELASESLRFEGIQDPTHQTSQAVAKAAGRIIKLECTNY